VALKCDLREKSTEEDEEVEDGAEGHRKEVKEYIDYNTGLEVARRIQALRYLGTDTTSQECVSDDKTANCLPECSSKKNRGVNEAFTEAARVALSVKGPGSSSNGGNSCTVM
jgi:Rho family protein